MTQWYAFQTSDRLTERAANKLADMTGADAFCVNRTRKLNRGRSAPRKVHYETDTVLKPYLFAGFESTPNFFRIHQDLSSVWPCRFAGIVRPLNGMNVDWITKELPSPLHRHYDKPRHASGGKAGFHPGEYVEVAGMAPVAIESVDGAQLVLALELLGRKVRINADDAQHAFVRAA